ncbi:hypothetical protein [Streptomyces niger]|uniref:hypothetical protein n=1 Tax=Streptomyces niger TaxID=66373 RepID=UPI000699B62B|nr:hypothetical protein [Streptomyces niger]
MARLRREGLRAQDRADFERLVDRALSTGELARAVRADRTGELGRQLRADALTEAAQLAEAAAPEYRTYLALREGATGADAGAGVDGDGEAGQGRWRGVLPLLGVLVPSLAAVAAAVFFLLGYLLRPAASQRALADALITAGQVSVVVTAASLACGVAGLLGTAARHRAATPGGADASGERLRQAREAWQLALLGHGIVPHLERRLRAAPPPARETGSRPRPGYSSPDFAAPDYATGDYATGDYASGDYASGDYTSGDYASGDYASGDYASPNHSGPDFSGPDSGPRH